MRESAGPFFFFFVSFASCWSMDRERETERVREREGGRERGSGWRLSTQSAPTPTSSVNGEHPTHRQKIHKSLRGSNLHIFLFFLLDFLHCRSGKFSCHFRCSEALIGTCTCNGSLIINFDVFILVIWVVERIRSMNSCASIKYHTTRCWWQHQHKG